MAKIQSLYTWLNSKHNVIDHMIKNYQMAGKKMILWGAGQRGCAFLEIYDPEAKYISVVYDSYQPKQNTVLPRCFTQSMISDTTALAVGSLPAPAP